MAIEKTIVIKVEVDDANAKLGNLDKKLGEVSKTGDKIDLTGGLNKSSQAVEALDSKTGGLAGGFLEVGKAAKLSGKAMKSALITSGIGLLLIIVSEIVDNWDKITNSISNSGKELQKNIDRIKGNLKTSNLYKESLKLQRDILKNQGKDLGAINILLEKNLLAEIKLVEAEIIKAKELDGYLTAKALEVSFAERLLAASQGNLGVVTVMTDEEEAASKARKDGILASENALLKLQGTQSENIKGFRDDEAAYDKMKKEQGEAAADAWRKLQDEKFEAFLKESDANEKAVFAEEDEIEKERQAIADAFALLEEDEEATVELENLRLENLGKFYENKDKLDTIAKNKKDALDAKEDLKLKRETAAIKDAKNAQTNAAMDAANSAFNILRMFAGKNKKQQKAALIGSNAIGIATNIINTKAANARLTAEGGVVGATALVAANNIRMYTGIAASIAATAKGLSAIGAGGSAGGGGSIAADAPSFNLVEGSGTNQIVEGLQSQDQPIQAYVVSGDVSSAQSLDRNIIENSEI